MHHRGTFICILFCRYIGQTTAQTHVFETVSPALPFEMKAEYQLGFSLSVDQNEAIYNEKSILIQNKELLHANKIMLKTIKLPQLWTIGAF